MCCVAQEQWLEDDLWELVLSLLYVHFRDQTQGIQAVCQGFLLSEQFPGSW